MVTKPVTGGDAPRTPGFCVWLAGGPPVVVAAVARVVTGEVGAEQPAELIGVGPAWLDAATPEQRRAVAVLAAGSLNRHGVATVVAGGVPLDAAARTELSDRAARVVEVWVGDDVPEGAAPDLVVPGVAARAGESGQVVLRHLAAAGFLASLDDYSDDDEAAVAGRLQNFGYL